MCFLLFVLFFFELCLTTNIFFSNNYEACVAVSPARQPNVKQQRALLQGRVYNDY
ncbi:hypothetical protein ACSS6W_005904 [Trichoderma asperelloides]